MFLISRPPVAIEPDIRMYVNGLPNARRPLSGTGFVTPSRTFEVYRYSRPIGLPEMPKRSGRGECPVRLEVRGYDLVTSRYQALWCCLAQARVTVPYHMARMVPLVQMAA